PLYVLRKFARRNRALVAAAGVAVLALLVGLAATLVLYQREKAQTVRALSLSTLQRLQELREEATRLWPHMPYQRTEMEAWIARAEELCAELPDLGTYLTELRADGVRQTSGEWQFASDETRWLHDSLARVLAEVSAFADPDPKVGFLAEMRQRAGAADARVDQVAGEHAEDWRRFAAVFASAEKYHGLVLEPQSGLVPLRADPRSHLWEFWHVASGARPELDPATDRWRILPETGIVFVLVPGGTFPMGAQDSDPKLPNYDPDHRADTIPVRELTLQPFFLSKYEMTRAQWQRFSGRELGPGDATEPVTDVSWGE